MGYYIEDKQEQTKAQFLGEKGKMVPTSSSFDDFRSKNHLPVMLVDNGFFTAAAICFSPNELDAFRYPSDGRPKVLFSVPEDICFEENPGVKHLVYPES